MSDRTERPSGRLGNPGREAGRVEAELLRRLCLIGIGANDGAAIRRLFAQDVAASAADGQASRMSDMLGLGLILLKLMHRAAAGGLVLPLVPATRALLEALQGRPAQVR